MEKLRKCPFCGRKASEVRADSLELCMEEGKDGFRAWYYVLCNYDLCGCGASGGWRHSPAEAVAAWNMRGGREVSDE